MNKKNNITGLTREDEIGSREKQSIINRESYHEMFKSDYLNDYFEKLNLSSNEPDWNIMILQAMKFNEFQDCKALLEMLEDSDYVMKYKYELEVKFEEMIDWFLRIRLGITTRPIPAYTSDNRKVNLLELYMIVKREGGHNNVSSNNLWAMVSKDIGHDYQDGDFMRIMYAMYLDVLIYYYKFKTIQEDVRDGKTVNKEDSHGQGQRYTGTGDKAADEGRRTMSTGCIPEEDREHYALFAGNDWMGLKKAQKR
ncbi:putative transcription factor & chromatin remodeling ARID family [Helianthus annuus]|nr:putative transcription factor & chromatin remodeling ARID family [Helianthus annuus]KAJ0646898.1 putative transcription factor & chromatin remodeling ARID family [Helianthus annuus]KAJ0823666.1 putative transcription factor & chromatin remodeling ARID family [Helianthus annuus]KAJ0838396.1 putative transcription factor & chromatin remodeling ARID family [Helianthus annuus]